MPYRTGMAVLFMVSLMPLVSSERAAQKPAATPTPANATPVVVHVYRLKNFFGRALKPVLFLDGVKVAKVTNGRYFLLCLEPGHHEIWSTEQDEGVEATFESGTEHYIQVEIGPGTWIGHGYVKIQPREQGVFAIKRLEPLDEDNIFDKKVATTTTCSP